MTICFGGKAFNFPGVIKEIAERLEYFTADGVPQRSYIRVAMQRVAENADDLVGGALAPPSPPEDLNLPPPALSENTLTHTTLGANTAEALPGDSERLDELAFEYYGSPEYWR